jgi:hypothetical protein
MNVGTDIFRRAIDAAMHDGDEERAELMRKVWEPTPWIVDVWTGGFAQEFGREMYIREWCAERFGAECFTIGGREGKWQRGSATIHGMTWMGFATKEMMNEFIAKWGVEKPKAIKFNCLFCGKELDTVEECNACEESH